jgi:hypothetical protein
MSRLTLAILAAWLLMLANPAAAYVWRCHTPNGDVWTGQPPQSGDCEEYDGTFNPNAVQPTAPPVQYAQPQYQPQYAPPPPPSAPPAYTYPYPEPYPVPYPYYPYPPRYYYGGPGLYLGLPPFVFDFRFGGHGGHFGGHRWR